MVSSKIQSYYTCSENIGWFQESVNTHVEKGLTDTNGYRIYSEKLNESEKELAKLEAELMKTQSPQFMKSLKEMGEAARAASAEGVKRYKMEDGSEDSPGATVFDEVKPEWTNKFYELRKKAKSLYVEMIMFV